MSESSEGISPLKEANRHGKLTDDVAAMALNRFAEFTQYRDFKSFLFEQATAFKKYLAEQTGQRSGDRLSNATTQATLTQLRRFFFWLADQLGYKSRIRHAQKHRPRETCGAQNLAFQHPRFVVT